VIGCLQWLDKKCRSLGLESKKSLINDFVVLELTDLLFLTIQTYCTSPRLRPLCIEALTRAIFDYFPDMRCVWHSSDDNNYCALAVTKRISYLFLDIVFSLGFRPGVDLKIKPAHRPTKPIVNAMPFKMSIGVLPVRPLHHYTHGSGDHEPVPEVASQAPTGLKPKNRCGLGRGLLQPNWKNNLNNNDN